MSGSFGSNSQVGRPRLCGDRAPSGRLRSPPAVRRTADDGPTLTVNQGAAARRYSGQYERAQRIGNAELRLSASDALARARAVLDARQIAIMDMVAGRGVELATLTKKTGRPTGELLALFLGACDRLSFHYIGEED